MCLYVFVLNLLQVIQRGWWQLFCRWTRPPTSSSQWLLPSWRAARPWPSTSQIRWGRWGEDSLVQDWWRIWPLFWIYIFKTEPKCIEKKDFVMSSHHKTKILTPPLDHDNDPDNVSRVTKHVGERPLPPCLTWSRRSPSSSRIWTCKIINIKQNLWPPSKT